MCVCVCFPTPLCAASGVCVCVCVWGNNIHNNMMYVCMYYYCVLKILDELKLNK